MNHFCNHLMIISTNMANQIITSKPFTGLEKLIADIKEAFLKIGVPITALIIIGQLLLFNAAEDEHTKMQYKKYIKWEIIALIAAAIVGEVLPKLTSYFQ